MRALNLNNPRTYLQYVKLDDSGEETANLLDAISTNVTHFFRENDHFVFMRDELQKWRAMGQIKFRLWSSACSSGEEPYSMAMVLCDALGHDNRIDAKILATDICRQVLEHAIRGEYEKNKIRSIPPSLLQRYFDDRRQGEVSIFGLRRPVRNMVVFRRVNLSKPPFSVRGPLDMIFCRNVMIYFDNAVRKRLVSEFFRVLKPGGYLLVGHSESLNNIGTGFKYVRPAVYRKPG